jgi:site-specific recombinase XerD
MLRTPGHRAGESALRAATRLAHTARFPKWMEGRRDLRKKKLERLRSFFQFALNSNWVKQNPVLAMRSPKVTQPPTLPLSKEEVDKILWACDLYPDNGRFRKGTPARLKALTLLMRYTGLGIGDAVTLGTSRVAGERLFLYTQKTNVPVLCPLWALFGWSSPKA